MDLSHRRKVEFLSNNSIVVSNKVQVIEAADGSKHLMPIVNQAAMEAAQERRQNLPIKQIHPPNSTTSVSKQAIVSTETIEQMPTSSSEQILEDENNDPAVNTNHHMILNESIVLDQPIKSHKHLAEILSTTDSTISFMRKLKLLPRVFCMHQLPICACIRTEIQ